MSDTLSRLIVQIGSDTKDFSKGLDTAGRQTQSFGDKIGKALGTVTKVGAIAGTAAIVGLGAAVAKTGIDFNSMRQQAEISFGTMLGSGEKAKSFLDELQSFAASTPFEFPELVQSAQKMMAMGTAAQDVIPRLTAIGDAAAALGGGAATVDGITTALGQMGAKGKVSAEEMGQLVERGVPAWDMLAKKIGVSIPEAMEMAERGAISADTAIAGITEGMTERFGGMMEAQSKTFGGMASTLSDTFGQLSGTVMAPFFEMATKGMAKLVELTSGEGFQGNVKAFAEGLAEGMSKAGTAMGEFIDVAGKVFSFLSEHEEVVAGIAATILSAMVPALIAWTTATIAQTAANIAAAAAFVAANAPLIAIATAIGLLVAGIVLLVKHWDDIVEKFPVLGTVADGVGAAFDGLMGIIGGAPAVLGAAADAIGSVAGAITDGLGAALGWAQDNWPVIAAVISGPFAPLVLLATDSFGVRTALQNAMSAMMRWVSDRIDDIVGFFSGLPGRATAAVGDLAGLLVGHGGDLVRGLWKGVSDAWDTGVSFLTGLPGRITGALPDMGRILYNAGVQIIGGLISGITDKARDLAGVLGDITSKIPSWKGPEERDAMLLFESGRTIIGGLIEGMASRLPELASFLGGVTSGIADAVSSAVGGTGGTGGGTAGMSMAAAAAVANADTSEISRSNVWGRMFASSRDTFTAGTYAVSNLPPILQQLETLISGMQQQLWYPSLTPATAMAGSGPAMAGAGGGVSVTNIIHLDDAVITGDKGLDDLTEEIGRRTARKIEAAMAGVLWR